MNQNKTFTKRNYPNKKLIGFSDKFITITLILSFLLISILFLSSEIEQILAQDKEMKTEPNSNNENNREEIQNLSISFDSIKINNDHDLLFNGEWNIDVYVNGKRLSLLTNSNESVEGGQTILFPKGEKSMEFKIRNNETLRIITSGIEYDSRIDQLKNYLPDIASILNNEDPLSDDKDKSRFSVEPLTAFDRNDSVGIIAKEFSVKDNFGRGLNHDYCSESSGESGDLYDIVDTNCDFRLTFTIE